MRNLAALVSFAVLAISPSLAADAARPVGEPVLERPTLHSLGVYWIVRGDDKRNASIRLDYRKSGAPAWTQGLPLFRVERGAHVMEKYGTRLKVPDDGWLFAGSALLLEPDTEYQLKLTLSSPDGKDVVKQLRARTRAEPKLPSGMRTRHVVPGSGGGTGTAADPFRGLAAATKAAEPGDLFLVHKGAYEGTWTINRSGTPGRPIVWRGHDDGEAILDGKGTKLVVSMSGTHDVWLEDLTIRNAHVGIAAHDCARLVVRRCHIDHVEYGLAATRDTKGIADDHFIADNVMEGPSTWPRTKGIEDARGIQVTGEGHVVCYNRIRGFADAIDTFPSIRCSAIDFHNNDLSELTDDGIEMDYSERNTRCFYNRMTNVFQGISLQPVYGGPVYVFRNVMYNVEIESFKLHNSPSGGLLMHNTSVKKGMPLVLWTNAKVRNCLSRNNLFVGTTGDFAYDTTAPMVGCDFDYDGFAGGPFKMFLRWNGQRYATLEDAKQKAPVYKHAALLEASGLFASGVRPPKDHKKQFPTPDLRLSPRSPALDLGQPLAGLNDGYQGKAPDLGAYELGAALAHYGPRPKTADK